MKEGQKQSSKVPVESFPLQDKKPHMKRSASYALKQVDTQRFSGQQWQSISCYVAYQHKVAAKPVKSKITLQYCQ